MSAETNLDKEIKPGPTSSSPETPPSAFWARHEKAILFCVLGLFLTFNIVTAPFSPDPWNDEVAYNEPAARLALTGHLTSHAWGIENAPVWAGNAPLHQLLLAGAIKIFGFNFRTVRGINVVYYTLAVFLMYLLVERYELVRKAENRLLFVIVLLSGTGLVALYRNGRYDALGALLVILWTWCSLRSRKTPAFLVGTFLSAILMPIASLNIAPLLMVCGLTAFILWRWKTLFALGATGVGCLMGMATMQVAYAHFGVPHVFHEIMKAAGGRDVTSDFILSVFKNPSYIVAIAAGCLLVFPLVLRKTSRSDPFADKIALALFLIAVCIPILMAAVAKYHIYYTWMAIIPGTASAFMVLEFVSVPKLMRMLALCLVLIATSPGFPRRCVRIAASWGQHRPNKVAAVVRKNASSTDVVFVNEHSVITFYALLPAVRDSFWLVPPTGETAKAAINVVFWPQVGAEKEIHDLFGGDWRQADDITFKAEKLQVVSEPPVHLAIYRRQ